MYPKNVSLDEIDAMLSKEFNGEMMRIGVALTAFEQILLQTEQKSTQMPRRIGPLSIYVSFQNIFQAQNSAYLLYVLGRIFRFFELINKRFSLHFKSQNLFWNIEEQVKNTLVNYFTVDRQLIIRHKPHDQYVICCLSFLSLFPSRCDDVALCSEVARREFE